MSNNGTQAELSTLLEAVIRRLRYSPFQVLFEQDYNFSDGLNAAELNKAAGATIIERTAKDDFGESFCTIGPESKPVIETSHADGIRWTHFHYPNDRYPPITWTVWVNGNHAGENIADLQQAASSGPKVADTIELLREWQSAKQKTTDKQESQTIDPVAHCEAIIIDYGRRNAKLTIKSLAKQTGVTRQALYENAEFKGVRELGGKLLGLFNEQAKRGDSPIPRGTKDRNGNLEAMSEYQEDEEE